MSKNVNLPEESGEDCVRIEGVIFSHSNGDYGLWDGLNLKDEDEHSIYSILNSYDTDGCSIREKSKKELYEEELRLLGRSEDEKKALCSLVERFFGLVEQNGVSDCEDINREEAIRKIYEYLLDADSLVVKCVGLLTDILELR